MAEGWSNPRVVGALIATIACSFLAILAFIKGRRQIASRYFAYFNLSLAIWNFGEIFVVYVVSNPPLALALDRISCFGATAMVPWYLKLVDEVTQSTSLKKRSHIFTSRVYFVMFVGLSILLPTPLIIKNVAPPIEEIPGSFFPVFALYIISGLCVGIYRIIAAYGQSSAAERNRLKYFFFAFFVGCIAAANYFAVCFKAGVTPVYHYFEITYGGILSYAILRHRLLDITVIIRRTLVYSAVMGSLALIYLAIIAIFAKTFGSLAGYSNILSPALAAALITFFFQPFRKRVQTFVDTKFFRQYVDREEKLYELSREVITHTTPEAMATALMRVLSETFYPKRAALFLSVSDKAEFERVYALFADDLPKKMDNGNPLALYFSTHSQPFIQDPSGDEGNTRDTRNIAQGRAT